MMKKQEIREFIAKNVAEEFEDGWLVNLVLEFQHM